MESKIKLHYKELSKKSLEELFEMRKKMEYHLVQAQHPRNIGSKGFSIKEEKKNIARVNTVIKEKERC